MRENRAIAVITNSVMRLTLDDAETQAQAAGVADRVLSRRNTLFN